MLRLPYDDQNIFAKILRQEIPCRKILENDVALAFYDLYPKAPVHALVIPKGPYCDMYDFSTHAPKEMVAVFYQTIPLVIDALNLKDNGFRLISNAGLDGRQEVPHFHLHILGGATLPSPF